MKQFLFYTSRDMYSHDLTLRKQASFNDNADDEIEGYIDHFKDLFSRKDYSALHIVGLKIGERGAAVEMIYNSYVEHPLKEKIIINAKAAAPKSKKEAALAQINPFTTAVWGNAIPNVSVAEEMAATLTTNVPTGQW